MFLPNKLKSAREDMGISGEDLVYRLMKERGVKISRNTLCSWETGDTSPNANQLSELCIFLGKPITYFFSKKMK